MVYGKFNSSNRKTAAKKCHWTHCKICVSEIFYPKQIHRVSVPSSAAPSAQSPALPLPLHLTPGASAPSPIGPLPSLPRLCPLPHLCSFVWPRKPYLLLGVHSSSDQFSVNFHCRFNMSSGISYKSFCYSRRRILQWRNIWIWWTRQRLTLLMLNDNDRCESLRVSTVNNSYLSFGCHKEVFFERNLFEQVP